MSPLGELVVSTLLAWWVLQERPGPQTLVGGGVVLGGLALLPRGRAAAPKSRPER